MAADSHKELQKSVTFGNWVRKDIQYSQFQNYELTYAHFVRFPNPFSWGNWQPGSSPGNYILHILWRDATYFYFPSAFLTVKHFVTNLNYIACAITHIISSRTVGVNNMQQLLTHNTNPISVRKHVSTRMNIRLKLLCTNQQYLVTSKDKQRNHQMTTPKFTGNSNKVISRKKFKAQYSNKLNQFYESIYFYKFLGVLKMNHLLKCQILIYQIRVKLITSWWRDKISW